MDRELAKVKPKRWSMINCVVENSVKEDFRRRCKSKGINMNSFLKACILTFTYPNRVEGFDDVIKFLKKATKESKKNLLEGMYNDAPSPLEGKVVNEQ